MIIEPLLVKVRRPPSILSTVFSIILFIWLLMSYVSMGVKINWPEIWKRLRRPWGVIVGILCQFIIMPVLAFALAKLTHLDNASAVGLIIIGCCPGGWLSNIFTLILDCDLILSITMTTCSTVIALALMPLNLFIYGRSYASQDESLRTPFGDLFIQLLILVIPVLIGMVIYYKLPKVAKILKRALRPLAIIMLILALCFGAPSSLYIFQSSASIYLISIVFPIIGSTLGLVFAKVACLDNRASITVAFETGSQNAFIALALARLSYPYPEADIIAVIPNLIAITTIIEGGFIASVYKIMKRFPGKRYYGTEESLLELEDGDTVITHRSESNSQRNTAQSKNVRKTEPNELNGNSTSNANPSEEHGDKVVSGGSSNTTRNDDHDDNRNTEDGQKTYV
ncbi:ileal sodium/bile acid cotransporter-like [Amphiura filiformis]|uniref:ileal sodium/bile acid cotransporter-like n=1 Tax=Amphiura filiformis TaxID=82378 RepID=UPI003B2137B7